MTEAQCGSPNCDTDFEGAGGLGVLGFSYCGIHCSELGVRYNPGASDRAFGKAFYETFTDEVAGKQGGYYYGNRVGSREFILPCFVEEITQDAWVRILNWVNRNQYGELEFDHRPGMKYTTRPAAEIEEKLYGTDNKLSGTFVIKLTAYNPFARMGKISVDNVEALRENGGFLLANTGLIHSRLMPPFDHSGAIGKTKSILLYNPGNERAALSMRIAGEVGEDGLLLVNKTTGQRCKIINLTNEATVDQDTYLEVDGEHGRVCTVQYGQKKLAYVYHDGGYIQLEGSCPIDRDMTFNYSGNTNQIQCVAGGKMRKDMEGKFVHLHGQWVKIDKVTSPTSATVSFIFTHSGTEGTDVVLMNEIILTGSDGLELPMLEFEYVPLYR